MFSITNGKTVSFLCCRSHTNPASDAKFQERCTLTSLATDIILAIALIIIGSLLVTGVIPWGGTASVATGGVLIGVGCLTIPVSLASTFIYWFKNG